MNRKEAYGYTAEQMHDLVRIAQKQAWEEGYQANDTYGGGAVNPYTEGADDTRFEVVSTWKDPDFRGGKWPYPTVYVKSEVTGLLAWRVRRKLGEAYSSDPVYVTERKVSGGYSEWTQDYTYYFTVECGGFLAEFGGGHVNGIAALLAWLED